jgi:alanine racemase
MYRPTWAEIDLGAIAHNIRRIKSRLRPGTRLMSVVKADAYGHGSVEVAGVVLKAGADYLAVATLDEAVKLREAGITAPLMLLGFTSRGSYADALHYQVEVTIFSAEDALALAQVAVRAKTTATVHFKLNTGMNRLGFAATPETVDTITALSKLPGLSVRGIFTHFAAADQLDQSFTRRQLAIFNQMVQDLKRRGINIPLRHCANSAAALLLPETQLDMVRAGIVCYGLAPSAEVDIRALELKPAMSLKSRIVQLRELEVGEAVSYGGTYKRETPRRIATVPIGYADGYSRRLSNVGAAWFQGRRVPLAGRVCMDQCMFDVTETPEAKPGDELLLFGAQGVTADDIAAWSGTINYEVVCMVSARVPRVYQGA